MTVSRVAVPRSRAVRRVRKRRATLKRSLPPRGHADHTTATVAPTTTTEPPPTITTIMAMGSLASDFCME